MITEHAGKGETEVKKWDFELKYGYSWDARARGYRLGEIFERDLISAVIDIEDASQEDAEAFIRFLDLEMSNQDIEIGASDASKYFEFAEPAGIGIETYLEFSSRESTCKSDKDENGKTIQNSKKVKVLAVIDSLTLTDAQKDALYYAAGYKESTLHEAPWHK